MVAISRQYLFGTDKAVQISRTVCCDKGTQTQYFKQKSNITFLIRTSDLNIACLFWFQTFCKLNIMLYFLTTHNWEKMCLEALAFKMAIKV